MINDHNSLPNLANDKLPTPINVLNKKPWKQNTLQTELTTKLKCLLNGFKIFN